MSGITRAAALSTKLNMRSGVGSPVGPRSSTWRVVSQGNDIYVSQGNSKSSKLSFHQSGICRDAFRQEFGVPITMTDRLMYKWVRGPVPDAMSGHACLLLRLWIATDFLSTATAIPTKKALWLDPAPTGGGRVIELLLSKDEEERLVNELDGQRTLIAYYRLPNGIAAVVATGIVQGSDEDFVVPASHHQKRSLLISASDPDNSGRPVRFFIGNNPNDGDHSKGSFRHLIFSDHIVRKQSVKTG